MKHILKFLLVSILFIGSLVEVSAVSSRTIESLGGRVIYVNENEGGKLELASFYNNDNMFYIFVDSVLVGKYSIDKTNHSYTEIIFSKDKNNINYNLAPKTLSSKTVKVLNESSENSIEISPMSVPSGYSYLGRIRYSVLGEAAGSRNITFYSKEQNLGVQTTTVSFTPGLSIGSAVASVLATITRFNTAAAAKLVDTLLKSFFINVVANIIQGTLSKQVSGETIQSYLHGTSNFGSENILSGKTYKILTPTPSGPIKIEYINEGFTAYNYRIHSQSFGLGVFSWFFSDSSYQIYSWS